MWWRRRRGGGGGRPPPTRPPPPPRAPRGPPAPPGGGNRPRPRSQRGAGGGLRATKPGCHPPACGRTRERSPRSGPTGAWCALAHRSSCLCEGAVGRRSSLHGPGEIASSLACPAGGRAALAPRNDGSYSVRTDTAPPAAALLRMTACACHPEPRRSRGEGPRRARIALARRARHAPRDVHAPTWRPAASHHSAAETSRWPWMSRPVIQERTIAALRLPIHHHGLGPSRRCTQRQRNVHTPWS